jgi:hypothetical protein
MTTTPDVLDRSDAVVVRVDPPRGPPERRRYEPTKRGDWVEITETWTGCVWRVTGDRRVESIGFEGVPPECLEGRH